MPTKSKENRIGRKFESAAFTGSPLRIPPPALTCRNKQMPVTPSLKKLVARPDFMFEKTSIHFAAIC
jgi:hypothetical protein